MSLESSFIDGFCDALAEAYTPEEARRHAVELLDSMSTVELAGLWAYGWRDTWARPKQVHAEGRWRTLGFLAGRGFGKTLANSHFVNGEALSGRAMLICLIAQDEDNGVDIMVNGPSGLIATAPVRSKPRWIPSDLQLVWPNGARAYVRTPHEPGTIRGLEYHLAWMIELQSWPATTRKEALSNVQLSTRLGYARIVWDATPKKGHPLLKELLADAKEAPEENIVVRGTTYENAGNLGDGYVASMERKFGGTAKGREELLGEMLEESEAALVRQEWIERARRIAPIKYRRRVIAIDPATTARKGSDNTGIVQVGLGVDEQAFVLGDYTGKHKPEVWAKIVVDTYLRDQCDCVIVETNKGGDLLTTNLRAYAKEIGVSVEVVKRDWAPRHNPSVIYVKEVYGRGSKVDRAQPLATAYERGNVSHVVGVDLAELEETLTSWEPQPDAPSPDRLDPLVYAVIEVLGLSEHKPDKRRAFAGIGQMSEALQKPHPKAPKSKGLAALLARSGGHGRI